MFLINLYNIYIKSAGFDFIKSGETQNWFYNFVYNGSILLFGGILLILLAILGIIFTLVPKKNSKHKFKNKNTKK